MITAISCAYLTWAIWVRRRTLRPAAEQEKLTERTITVSLLLQLAALLLMSPASSATIGRALYALFDQYNLDDYLGHCFYIGAVGFIGVNVASRLNISDAQLRSGFARYFALPAAFIAAIMLALIVESPQADTDRADFLECPIDAYLAAYWALPCAVIGCVLAATMRHLIRLRRDPRNRVTATLYLAGCATGVAVCAARIATLGSDSDYSQLFWIGDSAIAFVFAHASSRSWLKKQHAAIA